MSDIKKKVKKKGKILFHFESHFSHITDLYKTSIEKILIDWYSGFSDQLEDLWQIHSAQIDKLLSLSSGDNSPGNESPAELNSLGRHIQKISELPEHSSHFKFFKNLILPEKVLDSEFPVVALDYLNVSNLSRDMAGSFRQKALKSLTLRNFWLKHKLWSMRVFISGRIFRGKYYSPLPVKKIKPKAYLVKFLSLPLQKVLMDEWCRFNMAAGRAILRIHKDLENRASLHAQDNQNELQISDLKNELTQVNIAREEALQSFRSGFEAISTKANGQLFLMGTAALPLKVFRKPKLKRIEAKNSGKHQSILKSWNQYWTGMFDEWHKDADLMQVSWWAKDVCEKLRKIIESRSRFELIKILHLLMEQLDNRIDHLGKIEVASIHDVLNLVGHEKSALQGSDFSLTLSGVVDSFLEFDLEGEIRSVEKEFRGRIASLDAEYFIVTRREGTGLVPETDRVTVNLRKLIQDQAVEGLLKQLSALEDNIRSFKIKSSNKLNELEGIILYNLETVADMVSSRDDEIESFESIRETLIEGYTRSRGLVSGVENEIKELLTQTGSTIESFTGDFIKTLDELRQNDKLLHFTLAIAKSETKKKFRKFVKNFGRRWAVIYPHMKNTAIRRVVSVWKVFSKLGDRWNRLTRLDVAANQDTRGITGFLRDVNEYFEKLPVVYQRLFRFSPITGGKLFVGRTGELHQVEEAFSGWRRGQAGLMAVIGERGAGRTSLVSTAIGTVFHRRKTVFVQCAHSLYSLEDLHQFLVSKLPFPPTKTIEDLESAINNSPDKLVCVIEDLHRTFLKTITGIEVMNRFILFTMRTEKKIFWLITCSLYCWRYLDGVIKIGSFFGFVQVIREMNIEDLQKMILQRHQLSGIPIKFQPTPNAKKDKMMKKFSTESERQIWLQDQYFRKLGRIAAGNISVAMLFWLRSVKEQLNNEFLVSSELKLETDFLFSLSMEDLFSLTAILQHEMLGVEEFSIVMRFNQDEARMILTNLYNRGILVEKKGNYEIHFFLYRPLIRILNEKNLL